MSNSQKGNTVVVDAKKLNDLYQSLLKSNDIYANDVLDLMDNAQLSNEILDQVEQEVNEMDEKLENIEKLTSVLKEMDNEEIVAMTELISNAAVSHGLKDAPITNEVRESIAKEQAENMAKAINAAEDAKHPVKFALGQIGASLGAIKEIPSQMRDNISVARAAGLDCNTSLQNAALAVTAKTTDAFNATKSCLSRNATKIANGAVDIYNKAVDNAVGAWEKGKAKMENFMHKATKAFDIGMEAITLGGWSRFCSSAALRSNIANKNGNYNQNQQLQRAEAKGFEGGRKLFGVNLDNNKLVNAKEKVVNFLATSFTKLHGNMEGLSVNKGLSKEGIASRNQEFAEYWKGIKGTVWSKASDVREQASGVKGKMGATSPMDVLVGKAKEVSNLATKWYKEEDRRMHATLDVGKEMGNKTREFFKGLPSKAKSGFVKAKDSICQTARNVAADAVEYGGKGAASFLRGVSFLCNKAEMFDRSQAKKLQDVQDTLEHEIKVANRKKDYLEADLDSIKDKKVKASVEIPVELAAAKAQLMAASPTANIAKAINSIEKQERSIENKANRSARLHNIGVTLKNAKVIISDKVQLSSIESSIRKAGNKLNVFKSYKSLVDQESDMFEKWSNNTRDSSYVVEASAKELADKIRGKGRGDDDDDNEKKGPDLD